MLPHYSAFKVAETFSLLSTLYPHRVDLGIGRAPGTDMASARALAIDGKPNFERFPQQTQQLIELLSNPEKTPKISPRPPASPPIWMLGSSPDSALLAGQLGLPYNFALFINANMDKRIFEYYRHHFTPCEQSENPYTSITVNVVCAETEQEAKKISLSRELAYIRYAANHPNPKLPRAEEAANHAYSPEERAFLAQRAKFSAIGTPEQVKEKLTGLAEEFNVDEIMTITIVYDFEARKRSYKLLADAFF